MKSMLLSSSLMLALFVGCSEPLPPDTAAADSVSLEIYQQTTAELERVKKSSAELSEANFTLSAGQRKLRDEIASLNKANADLAKQQHAFENETTDLKAQLIAEREAKKQALELLYKERFAAMPKAEQDRLLNSLEKLNAGEPIGLASLESLANAGMIESDDPRYLEAKKAAGEK